MSPSHGILGPLACPLALGLLRLTTEGRPAEADAIAVIHFALDQGVRLLDTADSYCLGQSDFHFGEHLARRAVETWHGPRGEVRILTKAGLTRPKGKWVPNGRPEHLRKAVDGSLLALGVDRLFALQLHVHDSRVPFEETLAALAELQREGKIEHLGLCNVSLGELRQAQRHFTVALVQNELSVFSRDAAADGMVELTAREKIPFLAHRPLGGWAKMARVGKSPVLKALAQRHGTTPHAIALAALRLAGSHILPLVGATRIESVRASVEAMTHGLDVSDRTALEAKYSFAPSAEARAELDYAPSPHGTPGGEGWGEEGTGRRAGTSSSALDTDPLTPNRSPPEYRGPGEQAEVVVLMGIQGSGKSEQVDAYVQAGYARLNRDQLGGKLDDLVPRLVHLLASGRNRVVLDNTYPTRLSRAPIIAAARRFGVPTRCRHLSTPLAEAQYNIALRMIAKYGRPLGPEEMKALAKTDPNLPPPMALGRWTSSHEPPALDEGFAAVDVIPFVRRVEPTHTVKGLLLDVDGTLRKTRSGEIYPRHAEDVELLPGRREVLQRWIDDGYRLFFVSNQSGIASGKLARPAAEAAFLRTAELLRLPITEVAYCPHPAFPVGCYCRKPMPGLAAYLIQRHQLSREHLVMVGDMASDAAFAAGIGARYFEAEKFFSR